MKKVFESFFTNDKIMLTLVALNTCTIFAGGFGKVPQFFVLIDAFFTLLFVFETIVKIRKYGWKKYWKEDWNRFDFIITMAAIPSLSNLFIESGLATNVLLSLRILRVFKSFRLLKFIPNINNLIKGIGLAVKASFIVSIAFAVLMIIIAIFSSSIFGKGTPELFGDPGLSLFTIFKLFTGDGWSEIPYEIVGESHEFLARIIRAGFAILFFIGGILGLSLVNSIFVDAMASDNNDEVIKKLNKLEKKIDNIIQEKESE